MQICSLALLSIFTDRRLDLLILIHSRYSDNNTEFGSSYTLSSNNFSDYDVVSTISLSLFLFRDPLCYTRFIHPILVKIS